MQTERPSRANPARGVALIATAVILGLFILRNGYEQRTDVDTSTGDTAAEEAGGESTEAPAGGTTPDGETPVQAPERPPAEILVRVANASGVTGAAAAQTDELVGAGYRTVEPTDAREQVEVSRVLFAPGFDREAATLAVNIGVAPESVAPLSDPPAAELEGSNILVLLGPDLAG
jgi:hypothetical protein